MNGGLRVSNVLSQFGKNFGRIIEDWMQCRDNEQPSPNACLSSLPVVVKIHVQFNGKFDGIC